MKTITGAFTGSDADAAHFVEFVFREVYLVDSPYGVTLDED